MKIAVLSDTHRMTKFIDKIAYELKTCDLIVHGGDNFIDSKYIHQISSKAVMAVRGNCDFDNVEDEILFEVENKKIFLTHGDKYGVKYGMSEILHKAKAENANIVIFGHTHVPFHKEIEGITFINPGSLSLPREVTYRSYVLMNIENDEINMEFIKI